MSKISQKEAVFQAVSTVLGNVGVEFVEGQIVQDLMTKELRAQVNGILVSSFQANTVELDKTYEDEAELKAYASSLQSNWLRKDKRLNGSVVYMAKNPGSRAGASDPQLKALRALLSTTTDDDARNEIDGYIKERVSQLSAAKAPAIDLSALPPELAAKYSK